LLSSPPLLEVSLLPWPDVFSSNHELPVYATYRKGRPEKVKEELLRPLDGVDPSRLNMIHLDLEDESSIRSAAKKLDEILRPGSYLHTGFFTGGTLLNPRNNQEISISPPYRRLSTSMSSPISSS
jgi:hypothetical protein